MRRFRYFGHSPLSRIDIRLLRQLIHNVKQAWPMASRDKRRAKIGQRSNARNSAQREQIQGREEKGEIERKKRRKGKRKGRKEKERHESNKKIAGTKLVQVNK